MDTSPTEEQKTQFFINLYMYSLRLAVNNIFLKSPKEGGKRWENLDKARKIVDDLGGDYTDFIRLQFEVFKKLGFPPKPEHLITQNAINRYKIHQKLKNKYHYKEYSLDGQTFIVHQTNKRYPLNQVNLPSSIDPTANYAFSLAFGEASMDKLSNEEKEKAKEAIIYTIAKLSYKGRFVPEKMLKLYKEVQNV